MREREKESEKEHRKYVRVCVCMCVCVRERERDKMRGTEPSLTPTPPDFLNQIQMDVGTASRWAYVVKLFTVLIYKCAI